MFKTFTQSKSRLTVTVFLSLPQAVLCYQLAASQGHCLAQYRYARCLLQDPGSSRDPEQQRAVSMLKQAADSGLREVCAMGGVSPEHLGHVGPGSHQNMFCLLDHRPKLSSGCFLPRSRTWMSRKLWNIFGLLPTMGYDISSNLACFGSNLIKEGTLELVLSSLVLRGTFW